MQLLKTVEHNFKGRACLPICLDGVPFQEVSNFPPDAALFDRSGSERYSRDVKLEQDQSESMN